MIGPNNIHTDATRPGALTHTEPRFGGVKELGVPLVNQKIQSPIKPRNRLPSPEACRSDHRNILQLVEANWTKAVAARYIGVSGVTIWKWMKSMDSRFHWRRARTAPLRGKVIRAAMRGESQCGLAEQFKLHVATIRQYLKDCKDFKWNDVNRPGTYLYLERKRWNEECEHIRARRATGWKDETIALDLDICMDTLEYRMKPHVWPRY